VLRRISGPKKITGGYRKLHNDKHHHFSTDWTTGAQFPAEVIMGYFSLYHRVQTGSGAHQASYPMGTRDSYAESKAAEARS